MRSTKERNARRSPMMAGAILVAALGGCAASTSGRATAASPADERRPDGVVVPLGRAAAAEQSWWTELGSTPGGDWSDVGPSTSWSQDHLKYERLRQH